MKNHKIFNLSFAKIYPMYVQKAIKRGKTQKEVNDIIYWLTGYNKETFNQQLEKECDIETFFNEAPDFNIHSSKITGTICGIRVEEIEDAMMQKIRYLDKLIDELAKGKPMDKILRK